MSIHDLGSFQTPFKIIGPALASGEVIPFLGAGASIIGRGASAITWDNHTSAFPPTGAELSKYLAELSNFPENDTSDLAKVAQYFETVAAGRKPLMKRLSEVFSQQFVLGSLHQLLAANPAPLLIVTTNYDELIESAFRLVEKPFDLVVHTTDARFSQRVLWRPHGSGEFMEVQPNRLDIDLAATTVIYKMHGSVGKNELAQGQFVVTEDDYIEFLARLAKRNAIPAIFSEHFQELPFLFFGYGLRDWNFRVILSRLANEWNKTGSTRSWAVQRSPSPLEIRLWQNRGVELYASCIDDFVSKLRDEV